MNTTKSTRTVTKEDKDAAQRLRAIIKDSSIDLTQAQMADKLGFTNQGIISQFLSGKLPMNTDNTIKFANLYKVEPTQIRPELEDQLHNKQRISLADYNKVIEAVEIELLALNVMLDYTKKIPLYELAYKVYKTDHDLVGVIDLTRLMASR